MQKLPAQEEVVRHIQPMIPLLFRAIEGALQRTREFFDEDGVEIDRCLAPNLFRYYTKSLLASEGQRATYEEESDRTDYELQVLANNGLCLSYGRHEIRILKSDDDVLPPPGQSKARQKFWNWNAQMSLPFTYDGPEESHSNGSSSLHLIVLWDVDPYKYTLQKISLACPIKGDVFRDSVETHFIVELTHPLESLTVIRTPMLESVVQDDDLELELKEKGHDQRRTPEAGA